MTGESDVRKEEEATNGETAGRPSSSSAPAPSGNPPLAVVRLRGLPWDVEEDNIVAFFKPILPLEKENILICLGFDKRITGEAYVRLPDNATRDHAIKDLHGRLLGTRWIEVFRANEEEFNAADEKRKTILTAMSGGPEAADATRRMNLTVVKLRGLPWSCNEYEIVRFFSEGGFDIQTDDVVLGVTPDGRLSGIAFVDLGRTEVAEKAREVLHKKYMGRRFIEVYPATRDDMMRARRSGGRAYDGYGMMPPGPMRGPMRGGFRGGMGVSLTNNLFVSVEAMVGLLMAAMQEEEEATEVVEEEQGEVTGEALGVEVGWDRTEGTGIIKF
ncbi:rrm domain-containing [Cystoisospora suis]|uniref:Rrm domain-containing n=1 Tax=Cystoisospora suis TaxID=483139 RepID=A0A2C6KN83_9APIC|nr:rrm domain-containing [Cystoisospora suis]